MSETAPTVPWIVSSRVSPVKTRIVRSFSGSVSDDHDWTSLLSGTFSGSQKLAVSRSQTSPSTSSSTRFQLIGSMGETSVLVSVMCSPRSECASGGSEHARDAALDLGPLERQLAQADVVDRLDPLPPRVDLCLVD